MYPDISNWVVDAFFGAGTFIHGKREMIIFWHFHLSHHFSMMKPLGGPLRKVSRHGAVGNYSCKSEGLGFPAIQAASDKQKVVQEFSKFPLW
jgi:hypothetical protein